MCQHICDFATFFENSGAIKNKKCQLTQKMIVEYFFLDKPNNELFKNIILK